MGARADFDDIGHHMIQKRLLLSESLLWRVMRSRLERHILLLRKLFLRDMFGLRVMYRIGINRWIAILMDQSLSH